MSGARWGLLVLTLSTMLGASCRSRGTIDVTLGDAACSYTGAAIYLVPGNVCPCRCAECLSTCSRATCTSGCPSGICDAAQLDQAVSIDPPNAGTFSLVVELLREDSTVAASSCQAIEVDADGTTSHSLESAVECCQP